MTIYCQIRNSTSLVVIYAYLCFTWMRHYCPFHPFSRYNNIACLITHTGSDFAGKRRRLCSTSVCPIQHFRVKQSKKKSKRVIAGTEGCISHDEYHVLYKDILL